MAIDIKETWCYAPYSGVFQQINATTPCHIIRKKDEYSPMEYIEGEWRKSIIDRYERREQPEECENCFRREAMGLRSTRTTTLHHFNNLNTSIEDIKRNYENRKLSRLEIRFSNLCNFKCRMCEPYSSSELAREMIKEGVPVPPIFEEDPVQTISEKNFKELCEMVTKYKFRVICFTGGEPSIQKQCIDFMDYCIEKDLAKDLKLELFSNCSVYNPKFVERLSKFKRVLFTISVDGVGKVAEYIRHGTRWEVTGENMKKFAALPHDKFDMYFNTAISQYTLFDMSNLADFLLELYHISGKTLGTKCYSVHTPPPFDFHNMSAQHRTVAIDQMYLAIKKLENIPNFEIIVTELKNTIKFLLTTKPEHPKAFVNFTRDMDGRRNENFESVFGMPLEYSE